MLRFLWSGGNFMLSTGVLTPGIFLAGGGSVNASAPVGRNDTFAYLNNTTNPSLTTPNLGGNFTELIAGGAFNLGGIANNSFLIQFKDQFGNVLCDVRISGSGQLFFTRNGTIIGSTSTFSLAQTTWFYLEFRAIFSTAGAGTCEARVNGVTILTSTGLTNSTSATGAQVTYSTSLPSPSYMRDLYALDTSTGHNVTYLGDINVVELFANAPGVNSQWTPNVGPFTLTSVNTTGVYQGTITGGAGNAYVGYNFNVTGFVNGANNVTGAVCTASTATALTLTATTTTETHAGSAAFQAIPQAGINKTGTRPNGDVTYIASGTPNQISDFGHQTLTLSGIVLGVAHLTYAKKDDLGSKAFAQTILSGSASEIGPTISPGNSYQYYVDYVEVDPNTTTQFTVAGLNAATIGVKEIS